MTVPPSGVGSVTSFSVSVKDSPEAALSTSTDQASVPEGPVRGSSRLKRASTTGVGPPACRAPSCSQRQRSTAAIAATTPGKGRGWPSGGNGISKSRSSATVARASSFRRSQAASLVRRSIDSVLASAPRPRGCSAPLTHTSKGRGGVPSSPTKRAKWPKGCCTMKVQAALPAGSSGRPGQRRLASTGAGR